MLICPGKDIALRYSILTRIVGQQKMDKMNVKVTRLKNHVNWNKSIDNSDFPFQQNLIVKAKKELERFYKIKKN